MIRGYKYRIYPTEEQKKYFSICFAANRWFWNYALDRINEQYNKDKTHLSAQYNVARDLPSLKKGEKTSWIMSADAMSFIYTSIDLDAAFKKFFKKQGGFPRYKSRKYDNSYTIQIQKKTDDDIDWKNEEIRIGKAGILKARLHRRFKGTLKSITVSKRSYDFYEISVLVDDAVDKKQLREFTEDGTIGIDMGVKRDSNATLSDGTVFNAISLKREEKRIKLLKKRLSRKSWIKTGEMKFSRKYNKEVEVKIPSRNYLKAKDKLAKLEDKIRRIRNYNTHQISSYVAKNDDINTVVIEDLNVKGMMKNHHTANATSNANMGELSRQLQYKCDWEGKRLIKVGRWFPSSQQCSNCGYKNGEVKDLSVRQWTCPVCGAHHDRDVNAAINIKNEGIRLIIEAQQ